MSDDTRTGAMPRGRRPKGDFALLRHQARMLALQTLFEIDLTDHPIEEALANPLDVGLLDEEDGDPAAAPTAVRDHAERLARGTRNHLAEIDPIVAGAAPAFPLAQVAAIDRNVLRLAIYELLYEPEVPPKAAINEAVELAKRFGGEHSGRFVNGVLGTVLRNLPDRRAAPPGDGRR